MKLLTTEQLQKLFDRLNGTCDSVHSGLEGIGLDPEEFQVDEIEDQLLDLNLELCEGCGWWMESSELVNPDDDDVGRCEQCRDE